MLLSLLHLNQNSARTNIAHIDVDPCVCIFFKMCQNGWGLKAMLVFLKCLLVWEPPGERHISLGQAGKGCGDLLVVFDEPPVMCT